MQKKNKAEGDKQTVDHGITSEGKTGTEVNTSIAGQNAETKEEHMSETQTLSYEALRTKIKDTNSIICSEFERFAAWNLFPNPHGHQNYEHCKVRQDLEPIKWLNHTLHRKKVDQSGHKQQNL